MKSILGLLIFSLLLNSAIAQDARQKKKSIISPKTVLLNFQGQKDSLVLPVVSSKYPSLKKALSAESLLFDEPLDSVVDNFNTTGSGITSFDYVVSYENKDILSMKFHYETMGAYPSSYWRYTTLRISTSKPYLIKNEINTQGLSWIYSQYKIRLLKDIKKDRVLIKADKDSKDTYNDMDVYQTLKTSVDSLSMASMFKVYLVTPKGIIFTTEDVLPHVVSSMEPERGWFIPFSKLKPYATSKAILLK